MANGARHNVHEHLCLLAPNSLITSLYISCYSMKSQLQSAVNITEHKHLKYGGHLHGSLLKLIDKSEDKSTF